MMFIIYLMITDYRPKEISDISVENNTNTKLQVNNQFSIVTWNIGYAGLGNEEDFFMDGGTKAKPDNKAIVNNYLNNIIDTVTDLNADIYMIQEIDLDSDRSYNMNLEIS